MRILINIILTGQLICFVSCNNDGKSASLKFTNGDQQEIIVRETKTWEYSKTKEFDKLKEILAEDYIGYFGIKTMNENDVVNSLQKATIYSYELNDIRVKVLNEKVAIIYYTANQNGVGEDGAPWVPKVAAAATYVKRNGTWYSTFYQETVLEK